MQAWLFKICCILATALLRQMANLDMPDLDLEVPARKGLIIIANHRSVMDILVGFAIFRRWRVMPRMFVKARYFTVPVVGFLLYLLRAIPASRETAREAIQTAVETLAQGGLIALAPEGRVSRAEDRTSGLSNLRSGVGRLAAELGTTIVVLGITNTDLVWPLGTRVPKIHFRSASRPTVKIELAHLDIAQGSPVEQVMAELKELLSKVILKAESAQ